MTDEEFAQAELAFNNACREFKDACDEFNADFEDRAADAVYNAENES